MTGVTPFLGVARAPFLLLPVTLVAAGAAASAWEGPFGWGPTLLALGGLVLLHAAVYALNEASDMATGIDLWTVRTPFSGGSGTLPSGRLSVRATRVFARACIVVAGLIGGGFAMRLGPWFVLLLPVTLVAAGAAAAAHAGAFGWVPTVLALVGLVLLHAAVNALCRRGRRRQGDGNRRQSHGSLLRVCRTPMSAAVR